MDDWLNNMGDWNISPQALLGLAAAVLPVRLRHADGRSARRPSCASAPPAAWSRLQELHRPWIDDVRIRCDVRRRGRARYSEVGDAWLDAGIVPFSTLNYLHDPDYWETWFPADFITEMREQIRLWFYSMLFMSVTLKDRAPYQSVLAFEKLMDEQGKPMHKSLGNAIWFDEAAEKMGADVMRWLYCVAERPVEPELRLRPGRRGQAAAADALERLQLLRDLRRGSTASTRSTPRPPPGRALAARPLDHLAR